MALSLPSVGGESAADRLRAQRFAIGRVRVEWLDMFVVAATLVAALVRLPTLAAKGFWYDELISVNIARVPVGTILRARFTFGAPADLVDRLYTNNPPLHLLLIHAALRISPNEAIVRLPFALAGIATVPVAFQLLLHLFDRTTAALGASLLAVSPLHIAYSQEARPTAFFVFLSLLSLLYLMRALDGEGGRNWVLFAVVASINCWTSYFALTLVLPTLAAVAEVKLAGGLRHPLPVGGLRGLWQPGLAFGAVALSVLPLLPDLLMTADRNQVEAGDSAARLGAVIPLALAAVAGLLHPYPGAILVLVPAGALTIIGIWTFIRRPDRRGSIVAVWIVVPCLSRCW